MVFPSKQRKRSINQISQSHSCNSSQHHHHHHRHHYRHHHYASWVREASSKSLSLSLNHATAILLSLSSVSGFFLSLWLPTFSRNILPPRTLLPAILLSFCLIILQIFTFLFFCHILPFFPHLPPTSFNEKIYLLSNFLLFSISPPSFLFLHFPNFSPASITESQALVMRMMTAKINKTKINWWRWQKFFLPIFPLIHLIPLSFFHFLSNPSSVPSSSPWWRGPQK